MIGRFISLEIDSCRYVFLRSLSEPKDNSLRLLIQEADTSTVEESVTVGGVVLKGTHAILSSETSRTFELVWEHYIAYAVRNESFTVEDKEEVADSGRLLRIFSKSHYLDYIKKATIAGPEHPGPIIHACIICLNHIIDVAAVDLPVTRLLVR